MLSVLSVSSQPGFHHAMKTASRVFIDLLLKSPKRPPRFSSTYESTEGGSSCKQMFKIKSLSQCKHLGRLTPKIKLNEANWPKTTIKKTHNCAITRSTKKSRWKTDTITLTDLMLEDFKQLLRMFLRNKILSRTLLSQTLF